ncbi:cyclase family protein [Lachnospiraceae bacterium MD1]|uniref:Kynurenine formamidase n=1 Tax=Variimorphobacter saccharofermentans TaxID=2755051 RepID=A0A839K0G6_9FIRM|nr:cyclase family protein [Variimorphobacter saccharofermentans]MBB2183150.1 cyclase family protein [Variimorphobacter saccharofermentans]
MNYTRIYDISMPITLDMPVYKGKPEKKPSIIVESDYSTGNFYESRISMNLHTGTHLDRTLHMVKDGNTIENLSLDRVITPCKVLDLTTAIECISKSNLMKKDIQEGDFLLLKTRNSFEDILEENFIYLDKSGAEYLASKKIKGVGIDALGIERSQPNHETHLQLMKEDIQILEGLRLQDIEEGEYFLFAAPINIAGAEAAPVRAVLLQ